MKLGWKNHLTVLVLFIGSGIYFFLQSANNTKGLIINGIFTLNANQANGFYFVMGCLCIFVLALCGVAVYITKKQ